MRPPFFLFNSEKKIEEGHLKQMRECLRNNFFYLALERIFILFVFRESKGHQTSDGD